MSDSKLIWLTHDPAINKLSTTLAAGNQPTGFASTSFQKATRIAVDITVIESSLLTLGIAGAVLPVLPGITKLGAIGTASLAAVALIASTTDIIVQLGELKISMGVLSGLPDSDVKDVTDRLESLSDPLGAIIDKAIEFLGKSGLIDADMARLLKEAKAYAEARAAAEKAVTPQDKLKYGLAEVEAAKKFFAKLGPTLKEKIRRELEREPSDRALKERKPDYPKGVDYPNQPNNSAPNFGDGGTSVA